MNSSKPHSLFMCDNFSDNYCDRLKNNSLYIDLTLSGPKKKSVSVVFKEFVFKF